MTLTTKRREFARLTFLLTVYLFCAGGVIKPVFAQSGMVPGMTQPYANDVINESVNTNMLFASQNLISNGRFIQRRREQPDTKYETFRIPAEVPVGGEGNTVSPFILANAAVLRVTSGVRPGNDEGENDFSVSRLFALTGGGGASIRVCDGLTIRPGVSVSYARLRNSYDFNNSFSQQYLEGENSEFFNWTLDVFTYVPSLRIVYEGALGEGQLRYTVGYSHLFNDSFHATSNKIQIDSASGLLTNRVEYQEALGVSVGNHDLSLRPFFQWGNISGKAAAGLNFVNMYEVGTDFVSTLKESFLMFSELYVGASYVSADNFEGYHVGLGGHF